MARELKPQNIREMSPGEIRQKLEELGESQFNLRLRNSMRQLDNPLEIREVRREIARLRTILAEHEQVVQVGHCNLLPKSALPGLAGATRRSARRKAGWVAISDSKPRVRLPL